MEEFVVPHAADVLAAIKRTVGAMATEVKLPRLGQGMESGTIVKWLKSEGDTVEKGEPLYELDTDKVTQEVEAEASGVLLQDRGRRGRGAGRQDDRGHRRGGRGGSRPSGNGASAAQKVDEEPQEEGSPRPRREQERERGRAAAEQIAEARPAAGSGRRPGQGLAARAPDRARARDRPLVADAAPAPTAGSSPRTSSAPAWRGAAPRRRAAPARPGEVERRALTSIRKTIARRLTEAWQMPGLPAARSPPT